MDAFPVNFAMGFGDRLRVYLLAGSVVVPDAESLTIYLMRQQVVGIPMRMRVTDDWLVFSWQDLDNSVVYPGFRFHPLLSAAVLVGIPM